MKLVLQRVKNATVIVEGKVIGEINRGMLIFLGVMQNDCVADVSYLVKKVSEFRIFPDENYRMNKSIDDVQGEILVVSQFTLAADGKKGRRPSFDHAASPEEAKFLYEKFVQNLRDLQIPVQTGVFGAYMSVNLENDGPVTFVLEHSTQKEEKKT